MGHTAVSTIKVFRFGNMEPKRITEILHFNRIVDTKTSIVLMGPNMLNIG